MFCNMCRYLHATKSVMTSCLVGRDGRERKKARRDKSGAMLREGLSRRRAEVLLPLFARGTRNINGKGTS